MLVVIVPLTFFLDRIAHSSNVSAASYFPWRRYNAPKFFKVVVTVGLKINVYSITSLRFCTRQDEKLLSLFTFINFLILFNPLLHRLILDHDIIFYF